MYVSPKQAGGGLRSRAGASGDVHVVAVHKLGLSRVCPS
jgi:hypothetical protein